MNDAQQHEASIKDQIKEYRELQAVADSEAFQAFFDRQLKVVSDKMLWCFTGDNIKDWNDFCKVRGEVIARLEPVQTVFGAEAFIASLQQQLDTYYRKQL